MEQTVTNPESVKRAVILPLWSFRFEGRMPKGNFSFTCFCGEKPKIRPKQIGGIKYFICSNCQLTLKVTQRKNHFHISAQYPENNVAKNAIRA